MSEYVIAKYIRLSFDDAVTDSLSIPNQHLLLDRHIEDMEIPNATVLEFVDNGFTGTNLERPALQEMLDLVGSGRVNCIVCKDFSRFSRSEIESSYYIEQVFPLYRIRFIAVSDDFDSDNYKGGTGGIEVAFKFLMHEYYSIDLSRKVKSARRVKMQSGDNIVADAIYGYRKNESIGKWEPDPAPADVVKQIYSMALEGLPTAHIRDRLCAAQHPTPLEYIELMRGKDIEVKCIWTARMVLHILENVQYTGTYVSGKWEQKSVGGGQRLTDKSEWILIPDSHPPIISRDDFTAVQELLSRFKRSTTIKPLDNQLHDARRSKRARMISGEWIAATPIYGYSKNEDGSWSIDEAAAAVIREIYDSALQGLSSQEIRERLTDARFPIPLEHIRLSKGHDVTPTCKWTVKSVRGILKNIQYTGAFVSGKILKDYETGKSYHTPECDWIIIPGKNPPIVSDDTYNEVQEILAKGKVRRKNMRQRDYLLRGDIVKCGCCGYALAYDDSTENTVYRCHKTIATPEAECHKMKVSAAELHEAIIAIIKKQAEVVLATDDLSELRKANPGTMIVGECERQVRDIVEQRQICYEQFVQDEIDHDTYHSIKAGYAAQLEKLNNQLAMLRQMERDGAASKKATAIAKSALDGTDTQQSIVNALVDKIFVSPDNQLEIRWKFTNFAV
jgi:DNA invertase Pin-like site-specific DNA recombinase